MSRTTFIDLIMLVTIITICVFAYYTAITPFSDASYWINPCGFALSIAALWVNLINIQFVPNYHGVFKDE